jgi:SpoVK/Ycf46/Vps4 family AAA+-type ATPase
MGDLLRGDVSKEKRHELFEMIDKPLMKQKTYNLSKEEHRQLVAEQVKYLLSTGTIKVIFQQITIPLMKNRSRE